MPFASAGKDIRIASGQIDMGHALVQVSIAVGLVQGMEQLLGIVTVRRFERLAQAGLNLFRAIPTAVAGAILDRLVHNTYRLELKGESCAKPVGGLLKENKKLTSLVRRCSVPQTALCMQRVPKRAG